MPCFGWWKQETHANFAIWTLSSTTSHSSTARHATATRPTTRHGTSTCTNIMPQKRRARKRTEARWNSVACCMRPWIQMWSPVGKREHAVLSLQAVPSMRMQQSVQSETRAHETLASEPRLGVTHDGETWSSSGIVGCPRKNCVVRSGVKQSIKFLFQKLCYNLTVFCNHCF